MNNNMIIRRCDVEDFMFEHRMCTSKDNAHDQLNEISSIPANSYISEHTSRSLNLYKDRLLNKLEQAKWYVKTDEYCKNHACDTNSCYLCIVNYLIDLIRMEDINDFK